MPPDWKQRWTRPAAMLGMGIVLSLGLLLIPVRWIEPIRGGVQSVLRPGQVCVQEMRRRAGPLVTLARSQGDLASQLTQAERDRERLEEENSRLAAELAEMRSRATGRPNSPADRAAERLLTSHYVSARTLGQQARAFLARRHILDAGSRAGIESDALVIDLRPGLLDRGADAQLRPGQVVASQGRIWGKVAAVGPWTSTVQGVTESGYRDLVVIGVPRGDERTPSGPRGILEGTGEALARIRLVEVTRPVAVGDPVHSAAGEDVLPEPLLYGRVARVERPVGAAHWEIWMEPALAGSRPERVAVLQIELNPARVAGTGKVRGEGRGERD